MIRPSIYRIPSEYREGYQRERLSFFRGRVSLYCLVTGLLYTVVTGHYALRQLGSTLAVYRTAELPLLWLMLASTIVCYFLNRSFKTLKASKACAYLHTAVFLVALVGYGIVYREHGFLLVFYYGCALLMVALIIPWEIREIALLAIFFNLAFSAFMVILYWVLDYPVPSFPRFHPYFDGLVFMAISSAISFVIRHNDIKHEIANFLLVKRIEAQTRQFEKELELAHIVHKTLIPNDLQSEKVDIAVTYIPMNYVGGDCAKFRFLDENKLIIFISDVTGHGVPAALLVNRLHAEFERLVTEVSSPGILMKNLNRFISRDFEGTQMYISAFCGLIDFEKKTFNYSNYGHPSQYLYRVSNGAVESMNSHTSFLGLLFREEENYEGEISFERGDSILLFTDGVIETLGADRELYGEERLKKFIRRHSLLSNERFNIELIDELRDFSRAGFNDDLFILNVKTKP